MESLYPLRFREILRNYGFGNRWIVEAFEKEGLPAEHRVAETWEVVDRPGESSVVVNGPLVGETLHTLIERYGEQLLGRDVLSRCGTRFPLLIKFLDASNPLGEQVHQDDALAARLGLADPGKTEAWYMLKARPGATIHCGPANGVTESALHDALLAGTVRDLMQEHPVQPGDAFLLHAGTMHYSRGGVLFYEIMQNSDVIIGLRKPDESLPPVAREARVQAMMDGVHLEDGFDCRTRPVVLHEGTNTRSVVMACPYFALERLDLSGPYRITCDGTRFYVLSQIEGRATVAAGGHRLTLRPGHSCLLPAASGEVWLEPEGPCALLKAYVPDLLRGIVAPLREARVPDEAIVALGGHTRLNSLPHLVCCTR